MTSRHILDAFRRGRLSQAEAAAALRALQVIDGDTRSHGPATSVADAQPRAARATEPIAVIGMSGRFPGGPDLDAFWQRLADGVCTVADVPRSRWDMDAVYDPDPHAEGKTYSRRAGLLDDVACFDPLFFNISPREALYMDPQQRLFLEEAWRAFEDAGYAPQALAGRSCGVFAGVTPGDYHRLLLHQQATEDAYMLIGMASAILAARIAYHLDLRGPCLSIDTASSSSAVAIHQACQSLRTGECEMALAGGVCVLTTPQTHIMTSRAGMLSRDGLCKTFDNAADGFVPAEGVGVLLLKPLRAALDAGDHIHGVIAASGMNQNGSTNGITAPSTRAQQDLETTVYETFGIDPSTISYVECHGTGTKLGDPIEMAALCQVFARRTSRRQFCAIGSVKTNIGHAIAAAGVASVMKVLLSLRHGTLPASLHFNAPNEHIPFAESPFYVNRRASAWPRSASGSRRAAVNCIGFSGTNVHFVIEDPPAPVATSARRSATSRRPAIVPLSARTPASLAAYVDRLATFLNANGAAGPADDDTAVTAVRDSSGTFLDDLAYTLQIGRAPFVHRIAFVVSDVDDLRSQIADWIGCRGEGRAIEGRRLSSSLASAAHQSLDALVQQWTAGGDVDWGAISATDRPRRIPAPTYPFAKERYWPSPVVAVSADAPVEPRSAAPGPDAPPSGLDTRWIDERWIDRPLPIDGATDWAARLQSRSPVHVLALTASDRDREAFERVATGLVRVMTAASAADRFSWRVVDIRKADGPEVNEWPTPDVLISFISPAPSADWPSVDDRGPDIARIAPPIGWLRTLHERCRDRALDHYAVMPVDDPASLQRTFYVAALESLVLRSSRHALTCIQHDFEAGEDRCAAVAIKEWLSSAVDRAPVRMIRHAGGRRMESVATDAIPPPEIASRHAGPRTYLLAGPIDEAAASICDTLARNGPTTFVLTGDRPLSGDERRRLDALRSVRNATIDRHAAPPRAVAIDGVICVLGDETAAPPTTSDSTLVPALVEKRWIARELPMHAGRDKVSADALVLVNAESAEVGRQIAERCLDGTVRIASMDEDIDLADAVRRTTVLIDLADLHVESRQWDDDKLTRMRMYQQAIAAAARLTILHVTRHLQWFRCAATSLAGAKLTGLVTMLGAEYRHVRARHVDVDAALDDVAAVAEIVRRELRAPADDPAVCYRENRRYVPVLAVRAVSLAESAPARDGLVVTADAPYVVTGGTSGVGLEVAKDLVARGARRLVLMGITPLPPIERWTDPRVLAAASSDVRRRITNLQYLIDAGADLRLFIGPIADEDRVAAFLARIRGEWGRIRGAVHCAGRIPSAADDTLAFVRKNVEELQRVLTPKIRGLEVLARQLADDPLDFLVAFSSIAGLIPRLTVGVGDYGSANAFVDHFIAHRASLGQRHMHAVAWAGWTDAGVHTRRPGADPGVERLVNACGIHFTSSRDALRLLDRAIATPAVTHATMACLLDERVFQARRPSLLQAGRAASEDRVAVAAEAIGRALADADAATLQQPLQCFVIVMSGRAAESHAPESIAVRSFARWRRQEADRGARRGATWCVRLDPAAATVASSLAPAIEAPRCDADTSANGHDAALAGLDLDAMSDNEIERLHARLFAGRSDDEIDRTAIERTAIERTIVTELRAVLNLGTAVAVGARDRFQSVGLDSISGTQLAIRLERSLGFDVPSRWLVEHDTLAALADQIVASRRETSTATN